MGFDLKEQELHDQTMEFFPDYDSVRNYQKNQSDSEKSKDFHKKMMNGKKIIAAKLLGTVAAGLTLAMMMVPYVFCMPITIGEKDASFRVSCKNKNSETELYYLLTQNTNCCSQEILKEELNKTAKYQVLPEDGIIYLQDLTSRTAYQLLFFEETQQGGKTDFSLLGNYHFTSGKVPRPFWCTSEESMEESTETDASLEKVEPTKIQEITESTEEISTSIENTTVEETKEEKIKLEKPVVEPEIESTTTAIQEKPQPQPVQTPVEPVEPATPDLETPSYDEPVEPDTGSIETPEIEEPYTGTQEQVETEEPGTGGTTEAGTGEPEQPGTGEPEQPGTGEPEQPETNEPEKPLPEEPYTDEPKEPYTKIPE